MLQSNYYPISSPHSTFLLLIHSFIKHPLFPILHDSKKKTNLMLLTLLNLSQILVASDKLKRATLTTLSDFIIFEAANVLLFLIL